MAGERLRGMKKGVKKTKGGMSKIKSDIKNGIKKIRKKK